jgi:DNA-binding transcriptional LysR family regulator
VADLRARRIDVMMARYGIGADSADLDAAWLFRVPLIVAADRHNPLPRRTGLTLAATMNEPCALSPPHTALGRVGTAALHRHGLKPPAANMITRSITLRLGLIAGGRTCRCCRGAACITRPMQRGRARCPSPSRTAVNRSPR